MRESAVASHIRLLAAQLGIHCWRNNSGAFRDVKKDDLCAECQLVYERKRLVRFGLGSFTDKDECKSSDFILSIPTLITPEMVGTIVSVLGAVETKPEGWKLNKSDKRGLHQKRFIDMVNQAGGKAGFATSVEDFKRIIK